MAAVYSKVLILLLLVCMFYDTLIHDGFASTLFVFDIAPVTSVGLVIICSFQVSNQLVEDDN